MTNTLNAKIIITIVTVLLVGSGVYWYVNSPEASNVIVINSCEDFSPSVVSLSAESEVIFKNHDSFDHALSLGGQEVQVKAGESVAVKTNFSPGSATYAINCDGKKSSGVVVVSGGEKTAVMSSTASFKATYDLMPLSLQVCTKAALGAEFDKAYADTKYTISSAAAEKFSACSVPKPREGQVSFKSFYDGENATMKACLKSALGGEFDKAYNDPNYQPEGEHSIKIVSCLNNN